MAHQGDQGFLAGLDVRQLGFFEITCNPIRTGVDQGHQLHPSCHIGARARIHVRDISVYRGKDFRIAEV